jgi:hypothetical protein
MPFFHPLIAAFARCEVSCAGGVVSRSGGRLASSGCCHVNHVLHLVEALEIGVETK